MADSDTQLVQVGDHVPDGVQAINGRLLMLVYLQISQLVTARAERCSEPRTDKTAHSRIEHIQFLMCPTLQRYRDATIVAPDAHRLARNTHARLT